MSVQYSPDGQWWWDGYQWLPVQQPASAPAAGRARKQPTSWTRPMQVTVIVLMLAGILVAAGQLATLQSYFRDLADAVANQPSQQGTTLTPDQRDQLRQAMQSTFVVSLAFGAVIGGAVLVLAIIGTLRLWTWWFWVQVVLAGLNVLSLPQYAFGLGGVSIPTQSGYPVYHMPAAVAGIGLVVSLAWLATCVWMIVGYSRYGPWACRRAPA